MRLRTRIDTLGPAETGENRESERCEMLFFLHIPKTGGQTVATRLASAFLPERVHILQNDLRFPDHVEKLNNLAKTRDFVESHISGPMLEDQSDLQILTIIRNPIDRLISTYRHILREPLDRLHRAAHQMPPLAFFKNYGDLLGNYQIRCIVDALFDCPNSVFVQEGYQRWLFQQFHPALDRITYLVPFEKIDEFITLWSADTGRPVPQAHQVLNEAPPDDVNIGNISNIVKELPELYSLDYELWQAAQVWFASYRNRVLSRFVKTTEPQNSSLAFFDESKGNAVWLGHGWYPPIIYPDGRKEWWAGPWRIADIDVLKNVGANQLIFQITVVIGIARSEIMFLSKRSGKRLNSDMIDTNEGSTTVYVDVSWFEKRETIVALVPEVYSPIQIGDRDNDTTRRSFGTSKWYLSEGEEGPHSKAGAVPH